VKIQGKLIISLIIGIFVLVGVYFLMRLLFANPEISVEVTTNIISATVSVCGVLAIGAVAFVQWRKHLIAEERAILDREISNGDREEKLSERLSKAIEHFGSESTYIVRGALYELKRIAEESERDRENIRDILSLYIRENIEKLSNPQYVKNMICRKPPQNVFIAAQIMSELYMKFKTWDCRSDLFGLKAIGVNLEKICLKGALLDDSYLRGSNLMDADFEAAHMWRVNLEGTYLEGAELKDVDFGSDGASIDKNTMFPPDKGFLLQFKIDGERGKIYNVNNTLAQG